MFSLANDWTPVALTWDAKDFPSWQKFWGLGPASSVLGQVEYQGGDLAKRAGIAPEEITPEDFRLAPGSAGKGAAQDGGDLGADVNLVGPGKAYEAWKKTEEYQKWIKDTGQLK